MIQIFANNIFQYAVYNILQRFSFLYEKFYIHHKIYKINFRKKWKINQFQCMIIYQYDTCKNVTWEAVKFKGEKKTSSRKFYE